MPRYDFLNTETGEVKEYTMSWKELDQFKEDNPHLKQQVTTSGFISSHGMQGKMAKSGFNEVLSKVAEAHPGSALADTHGNKSIKDIKTQQVIKKHIDKGTIKI